jgi:S-methyl-5-thioribose-1-phosphate isomerase
VALAALTAQQGPAVRAAARRIAATRPTAVNLAWGVERALEAFESAGVDGSLACADAIAAADVEANRAIGRNGAAWLADTFGSRPLRMLTHCNAGHLATVGYGTALGVVRARAETGGVERVWVDETRPLLQGARLTAWELSRLEIPHSVIVDSAAASLMAADEVDVVVVGADRVAANGDVANKIGTYGLAVLARHHDIPFLVAAPNSTLDPATPNGSAIEIEARDPDEISIVGGRRVTPSASHVFNPAFDVTPAALVTALIGEVTPPDFRCPRS